MSTATYPYWDTDNRYLVSGYSGRETLYGWVYLHPSGFYRWRCGCNGAGQDCPRFLSTYYAALADAQSALQSHLANEHYIVPPGSGPPVLPQPPQITSISPAIGPHNAAFTLTVNGLDFTNQSVIHFDGLAQVPTTYTSPTQLSCPITAAQIVSARSYTVQVFDPVSGSSNPSTFTAT